ncbi:unnamed protein product [Psylliodes chrysocephalus]|uniref:Uncharacterized protein n=1 Tax=Psylliodes chrysocephalus TaxID=3402493 RepID=A0A9P0D0J6_9CUCU|nr:unnamed protein product [Psylliodes chrysocephala]
MLPKEYIDIISEHATVHNVTSDIAVLNWKSECKNLLKITHNWHFQINKCKRNILCRRAKEIFVRGEISYRSDLLNPASLMKKGKKLTDFMPRPVPLGSQVKAAKLEDVDKLVKKHYGNDWQTTANLKFYKDIITLGPGEVEETMNDSSDYLLQEVVDLV